MTAGNPVREFPPHAVMLYGVKVRNRVVLCRRRPDRHLLYPLQRSTNRLLSGERDEPCAPAPSSWKACSPCQSTSTARSPSLNFAQVAGKKGVEAQPQ